MHYQKYFWANIYSAVMICTLAYERDRNMFIVNSGDIYSDFTSITVFIILGPVKNEFVTTISPAVHLK